MAYDETTDNEAMAADTRARRLGYLLDQHRRAREINKPAWMIVRRPAMTSEAYDVALQAMEHVVTIASEHKWISHFTNTLGVARYRAGHYEDALAALTRSYALNQGDAANAAFLAMAHHQLGHEVEARQALGLLRELMQDPDLAEDVENQAFLEEAEALLIEGRKP